MRGRRSGARTAVVGAACLLLAPPPAAGQGDPTPADRGAELPPGVTEEMVERGRRIFLEDGFCYTCHGRDARGIPQMGSDLTDGEWVYLDGSFPQLVERIRRGVPATDSRTGVPMPPAGGARLEEPQLRAVAAYVWSLNRGGG